MEVILAVTLSPHFTSINFLQCVVAEKKYNRGFLVPLWMLCMVVYDKVWTFQPPSPHVITLLGRGRVFSGSTKTGFYSQMWLSFKKFTQWVKVLLTTTKNLSIINNNLISWFFLWCKMDTKGTERNVCLRGVHSVEVTVMSSLWSLHWQFTVFSNLNQMQKWHVLVLVSMKDVLSMFV